MSQARVNDANNGRRDQTHEKEEVHDTAGFFRAVFGSILAKPYAENQRPSEESDQTNDDIIDSEHVIT